MTRLVDHWCDFNSLWKVYILCFFIIVRARKKPIHTTLKCWHKFHCRDKRDNSVFSNFQLCTASLQFSVELKRRWRLNLRPLSPVMRWSHRKFHHNKSQAQSKSIYRSSRKFVSSGRRELSCLEYILKDRHSSTEQKIKIFLDIFKRFLCESFCASSFFLFRAYLSHFEVSSKVPLRNAFLLRAIEHWFLEKREREM